MAGHRARRRVATPLPKATQGELHRYTLRLQQDSVYRSPRTSQRRKAQKVFFAWESSLRQNMLCRGSSRCADGAHRVGFGEPKGRDVEGCSSPRSIWAGTHYSRRHERLLSSLHLQMQRGSERAPTGNRADPYANTYKSGRATLLTLHSLQAKCRVATR